MRWERELPALIRKLRNEHVHYAQTIRQLLEPITTEVELDELLTAPGGAIWKNKDMTQRLHDKLSESFHAYQSTIADIERIMKDIARKLDIDRAAEARYPIHSPSIPHPLRPRMYSDFPSTNVV